MTERAYRPTRREVLIDIGLTAVFLAFGIFEYFAFGDVYVDNSVIDNTRGPEPLLLLLTALTIAPLAVRRRYPVTSVIVSSVFYVLTTGLDFQVTSSAQFSLLIPFYGLALYVPPRRGDIVRAIITVAMVGWVTLGAFMAGVPYGLIPLVLLVYVSIWVVGNTARARQQNAFLLQERAERAEHDREQEAARAVRTERARIARELHDVVAHSITVMTVQATGAKRVLETDPGQAKYALEAIEATGRQALSEMRRMVGVMRTDDRTNGADIGLAPQPGLIGLPDLFDQVEAGGLEVDWTVEGEAVPLPPGVELAVYRIVQEALTNTIKHGGPAPHAEVTVRYVEGGLVLQVADDGRGVSGNGAGAAAIGQGLVGMRERVALYGGTLEAGSKAGGGFEVSVRLPIEASR